MINYFQKRRLGMLSAKLVCISAKLGSIRKDSETQKAKSELNNFQIFNGNEYNFASFLKDTEGKYANEYSKIESLCNGMNNIHEIQVACMKCRELNSKLCEEIPLYMQGLMFGFGNVYITWLEILEIFLFTIIRMFIKAY